MRKGTVIVVGFLAGGALLAARGCSSEGVGLPKRPEKLARGVASASPPLRASSAAASRLAPAASRTADPAADQGGMVFFSPWGGSHRDQLGHERPSEGNPVGPMSLGHDAKGRVYVLDQVNGRVVRHGPQGALEATSEVTLRAAQDLAVAPEGALAVLDRMGDRAIALYDPNGLPKGQLSLEGEGVPEPGNITGVFIDGNDVFVEREHGPLVHLGDLDGTPAVPRTEIPGRPSRDGRSFLNAGIVQAREGRAYVSSIERATGQHRFTRELRYPSELRSIVLLDSDAQGTIYFAVELHEDPNVDQVLLQCLEPRKGVPMGSVVLPVNTLPEESFRDLSVLHEGGVTYALRSHEGVSYRRYTCDG